MHPWRRALALRGRKVSRSCEPGAGGAKSSAFRYRAILAVLGADARSSRGKAGSVGQTSCFATPIGSREKRTAVRRPPAAAAVRVVATSAHGRSRNQPTPPPALVAHQTAARPHSGAFFVLRSHRLPIGVAAQDVFPPMTGGRREPIREIHRDRSVGEPRGVGRPTRRTRATASGEKTSPEVAFRVDPDCRPMIAS